MKLDLPDIVSFIINTLNQNGFECFVVGGCVRDSLSNKFVNDWDFTTNATPDEIENCFSDFKTIDIGKKFGTICVVINDENYEITTYRTEEDYTDMRHPQSVSFSKNLKDDLSRRDFTINAMAYNDTVGLVDEYDGLTDLKYGVIRCIGNPDERFSEDALRILRALRFASVFGYSIEPQTSDSIIRNKDKLSSISSERIVKELSKLLCGNYVDFVLRRYKEVIAVIIPEISIMFNFDQHSLHHNKDLWRHTVSAVKNTPPDELLRTVMLLHDLGKPMTVSCDNDGHCHFHNHPKLSSAMAKTILKRLKYPVNFINTACLLIENHDNRLVPTPQCVKQCMNSIGKDNTSKLLSIQRADIMAQSMYKRKEKINTLDAVQCEFERVVTDNECFSLDTLAVNGKDIIHLGVSKGETIGFVLNTLLDKVINDEVENEHSALIAIAETLI